MREEVTVRTGSRVSGVTPHLSSQFIYVLPNVFSGSALNLSISKVFVLIRGLSLRILRPSADSSMMSRSLGNAGPAVVSPRAAMRSVKGVEQR